MPIVLSIRRERHDDADAIRRIVEIAFGRRDEADLIEGLRLERAVLASFVAVAEERVVGHLLFSRVLIEQEAASRPAVALAPLAVLPDVQRQRVGTRLVHSGLEALKERGEEIVFVLGDPAYYGRFGFSTEMARRFTTPFPAHAFMAIELAPGALTGVRGRLKYPCAFRLPT